MLYYFVTFFLIAMLNSCAGDNSQNINKTSTQSITRKSASDYSGIIARSRFLNSVCSDDLTKNDMSFDKIPGAMNCEKSVDSAKCLSVGETPPRQIPDSILLSCYDMAPELKNHLLMVNIYRSLSISKEELEEGKRSIEDMHAELDALEKRLETSYQNAEVGWKRLEQGAKLK
jgi:hypothetical protein